MTRNLTRPTVLGTTSTKEATMSRTKFTRLPLLARLYLLVAAADLVGALVAIQTGLAHTSRAIGSGTAINAPFAFLVAQLAIVTAAVAWRERRAGTLAAALLVLIGLASVLSGFGDSSYTANLTLVQRAVQIVLVTATTLTVPVAAAQVHAAAQRRRTRTATATT
jgi:hypothetical protein